MNYGRGMMIFGAICTALAALSSATACALGPPAPGNVPSTSDILSAFAGLGALASASIGGLLGTGGLLFVSLGWFADRRLTLMERARADEAISPD